MSPQTLSADGEPGLAPPAGPEAVATAAEPESFSRRLLFGSILISCMLHVASAAAMLIHLGGMPEYGVISEQTEAISVEMTASTVLEAVEASPSKAAAAAVATATQEGNPVPASAQAVPMTEVEGTSPKEPVAETVKASEVKPDVVRPTEDPLDLVRGAGEPSDAIATKAVERAEEEQKKPLEKQEMSDMKPTEEQLKASAPQVSGGVTARAAAEQAGSQGRVSASRGSLLSYAAGIRAKVARHKPSGVGLRGQVQVSFGVTLSGELSFARLAQSSGNAKLDEAAIEAVRRSAPFAPPPANASPAQLRFSIPFYFR